MELLTVQMVQLQLFHHRVFIHFVILEKKFRDVLILLRLIIIQMQYRMMVHVLQLVKDV